LSKKDTISDNALDSMKKMKTDEKAKKLKESVSSAKQEKITKEIKWYKTTRELYDEFAEKVSHIIGEILDAEKIDYAYLEWRSKEITSFEKKLKRGIVKDGHEMQDLAGIRIVCYISPVVEKTSKLIKQNFKINEKLSLDKSKILGEDKVGYQSIHFVASLSDNRQVLPENKKFKDLQCEIQIRTILQHAWAEIEHEKKYKFSGELPKGIPRRFNLIAGLLELADKEFVSISKLIDEYSEEVKNKTKTGKLNIPINATSLMQYLLEKHKKIENVTPTFRTLTHMQSCLITLELFEIKTLEELDKILSDDLVKAYSKHNVSPDFTDIVIGNLLIKYKNEFLEKTKTHEWTFTSKETPILEECGVDTSNLTIFDEELGRLI